MKFPLRPRDTIAWRFGATIAASIVVSGILFHLFFALGGSWAQPPIDEAAHREGAAAILHIIEAAPQRERRVLAEAAATRTYRVDWYAPASAITTWLDATVASRDSAPLSEEFKNFQASLQRTVVAIHPDDPLASSPDFPLRSDRYPDAQFYAVKLEDGSWAVFTVLEEYWGISQPSRNAIWIALFVFSCVIVSAAATRQLSRPIRRFAEAVRNTGNNPHSPPIAEDGPQELREVIAAFNEMQAQIQEFVAYRTAMLSAISHDLRTPLTRMRLRGEFIENTAQRERLFRDVDEMRAMIDGALAFFRGEGDDEERRTFNLPDILQSITDDYADQDIEVGYKGPSHLVYCGRPIALKRAFTNLVENAVKYGTPPRIELASQDDALTVTIRDQGPGIPADALEKVFKPFHRLDVSRNRETGGVGLGLTAAQAVVRGHGGDIALRNHPEGGLEASVTLPLIG